MSAPLHFASSTVPLLYENLYERFYYSEVGVRSVQEVDKAISTIFRGLEKDLQGVAIEGIILTGASLSAAYLLSVCNKEDRDFRALHLGCGVVAGIGACKSYIAWEYLSYVHNLKAWYEKENTKTSHVLSNSYASITKEGFFKKLDYITMPNYALVEPEKAEFFRKWLKDNHC